jgi:hypothetical protein
MENGVPGTLFPGDFLVLKRGFSLCLTPVLNIPTVANLGYPPIA